MRYLVSRVNIIHVNIKKQVENYVGYGKYFIFLLEKENLSNKVYNNNSQAMCVFCCSVFLFRQVF